VSSQKLGRQTLAHNERIIPPHAPGMRIGLFGGTFDPPHQAHLDACLLAMKRLKLDRVWWLVTPGNPLKNTSGLAPLAERLAAARKLTNHPRIDVTGLEAVINTRYTYDTILWLLTRCPRVDFVWIMGADNLRHFHRWQKWRGIAELVPMVVVDRPGPSLYAAASTAGQALSQFRIPESAAASLPGRRAPVWAFLHGLKSGLSSTALRALRGKPGSANTPAEPTKSTKSNEPVEPAAKKTVKTGKTSAPKKSAKKAATKKTSAKKSSVKNNAAGKTAKKAVKKTVKKTGKAASRTGKSAKSGKAGKKRAK
jgi:nicotinate-nucleotide adenylyltransferase